MILVVYGKDAKDYTIAWKTFDHELIINSIKADIVQLNGYYQHIPKMKSIVELPATFKYGEVVNKIVKGSKVASIISSEELAIEWGVLDIDIIDIVEYLRTLGYEIRNHMTNPQIEEGHWLIPYAFPTLTPQSVQLRKRVK